MYHDCRIPAERLDLLQPGAAPGWLVPWLSTDAASSAGSHVQARRDRHGCKSGSIRLYLGRTSPLEVRGRPRGRLRLHADRFYQAMTPDLFAHDMDPSELATRAPDLAAHAERAVEQTHRSFLDGEAVVHAGLMRHYGPLARGEEPWLAWAAWQVAFHVARFRSLLAEHPNWFSEVLGDLARDKACVGLLGRANLPDLDGSPEPTNVIAAPDPRHEWLDAWRRVLGEETA